MHYSARICQLLHCQICFVRIDKNPIYSGNFDQIFWIEYLSLFYFLEPLSLQFVVTVGVKDENLLIGAIPDASETDANE